MSSKDHEISAQEATDRIWELAESIRICMFVTWDGERQRVRPLAAMPDRAENAIYFLTDVNGLKDDQIERFPIVTLAFADTSGNKYVSVTGKASVSNDRAKIRQLWTAVDKAWWDSADDPQIRLITVTPDDGELWDGQHKLIATMKMLASAMTGGKPDMGHNRKVSL